MHKNRLRKRDIFLWAFLILGAIFTLVLIWTKDLYMENSDIASDLILGKILTKEGGIMSKNWYYSTELHVFHTQVFYKYLFYIWPDNWLMVRFVAAIIFLVLIVASFLFMTRSMGFKSEGLLAAGILAWPFGQWYVRIVLFGQSYVTYFIIAFFSLGLFFDVVRPFINFYLEEDNSDDKSYRPGIKEIVELVILLIVSFVAGLGGVRLLMICYAPLLVTAIIICLYAHVQKFKNGRRSAGIFKSAVRILSVSFVPFAASCVGLAINRGILAKEYSFQDQFREDWNNFSFSKIMDCFTDSLTLFGWHEGVGLVSWQGLINGANLLLLIGIVISIYYVYKHFFRFNNISRVALLFFAVLFLMTGFILSCSNKYFAYYWIPVIPYMLIVLGIAIETADWNYIRHYAKVIYGGIAVIIALASVSVCADPNPIDEYQDYDIVEAIEWLQTTDYTDGFGLFWSSNVIIPLSNGRIDMHTVQDIDRLEDLDNEYRWLQSKEHMESLPEGRFFVIVSARDYDLGNPGSAAIFKLSDHLVFGTDSAYIYSFDSMEDYLWAKENAE